ncbi:uncharacterized protein LOC130716942 isoform X1 [Lotus japonicus]|uniref:uncharacterized protein LOC130716942 isoform X1 n=1 Tax=Lotus japonicus TaxID=34305 RepID=UPI00258CBFD6|nr:uncharacterized protein LOC130716942 isoform X1 [Lotus japonicus]
MSHRDSDSKLRHSKFDREPSPKRYRRDGKQDRERDRDRDRERERGSERGRDRDRVTTNGGGGAGGDQNPIDRDQRNLPPPPHSKQESVGAGDKKSNDHQEPPKHSAQPPRSRSYYQHAERGNTEQVGRSAGRREAGGKAFAQSKENSERVETSQSREQRDEKSQAKLDDNLHRRDGSPERKDDPPSNTRKRPAFREKKIQGDSGDANPAVSTERVKASHTDHPPERNERKEERSGNPRHLERHEKQIAGDRAPNRSEGRRDGFSSRARYGGSGGNNNDRGRDKFNARQGYHPIKTRTEKWKHDLFQEADNDPVPKNEDDQIAKLEALLAS